MTPAVRPVMATPQQRANARAALELIPAWMRPARYADQADALRDRVATLAEIHAYDPEVRRLTEEVQGVR